MEAEHILQNLLIVLVQFGIIKISGRNSLSSSRTELTKICPVEPAICSCAKYNKTSGVESTGGQCWKL
jgi:hypothetical protein